MARTYPSRLLRLPDSGQLIVCTDLHGNLKDFQRMAVLFTQALEEGRDPFLLFTGDLIHGPSCEAEDWPDYLGSFFPDESQQVVEAFIQLQTSHPKRVACLLGNHEHSHVGGPHTPKFWPDETLHFERVVGPKLARRFKKLFRGFPAVAVSRCGVAVTHAAPNVKISGPKDIARIRYEGLEDIPIASLEQMPVLGRLLWSRQCHPEIARNFLSCLCHDDLELNLVVYGHEIIPDGYEVIGREQLLLSTSFGVADRNKTYLVLELQHTYSSASDLKEGIELRRLYREEKRK